MQPKKKSMTDPIIYGLCLLFVLYFALHGAAVYESVVLMIESGEIEKSQQIWTFMDLLSARLTAAPLSFRFNQYTKDWLTYCGFGWMIVVLAIVNNKKDYIHKKEYGTSRWGLISDIRDLFASSIEAEEINKAKEMRTKLGRWKVRSNTYKQCELDGRVLLKSKLDELNAAEEKRKQEGSANKKLYQEQQAAIRKEVKETVALSKRQAWYPDQLKMDLDQRLKEINESQIFSDAEKEAEKKKAKAEHDKKLADFYNNTKRIAKIKAKYKDADMLFTKTERISFYNWKLNQNTLILGGSGSGKTRGFVMPNILQAHSSYIVTDPKGEILEKAGYFLEKVKGYKIRVLNLDEKTQSDGYNPFIYIHPERGGYEERVLSLIETIIVNTDGGEKKGGSDPFWDKAERLFLQAVFFFTTDGFVPEERNMNTVLKLITMLEIGEEQDDMNSDLDVFARIFKEKYGEDHIGVQQYQEFRSKASGKTAKSIVISAVARLAPFRTSAVKKIFSYDSMHLDRVGEEKTAIFVVVPPTDTTFNFIAGMLFTQLFQELQYCATQVHKHDGQRLPVPCRFILDEFANTCTIPNFVKILAYARSFGIGIVPILQSLEQIKNMYKDEWGVIIDNCNTLLYLGSITHMDTLEYMSKLLGKGTFDKRTTGETKGRQGSSSQNFDVVGRELMFPSEIREMPKNECLLVVGGRPPFRSEKYEYKEHPNYRFTSDANGEFSYHYTPEPPPGSEKQNEEQKQTAHGEDTEALVPGENSKVEIEPIRVEIDPVKQLSYMTKNVNALEPIPDEDMIPDDGENTVEQVNKKTLQELLGEEEAAARAAKEEAKKSVSEETQAYLDNLKQNKIRMEENLLHMVNHIGRSFRDVSIIPDEDLIVDDGETTNTVDEKAEEYIMEEEQASPEELSDIMDDVDSLLADLELDLG